MSGTAQLFPVVGAIPIALPDPLPTQDASDGTPGTMAPATALQVGGTDGTDLRALATDSYGRLLSAAKTVDQTSVFGIRAIQFAVNFSVADELVNLLTTALTGSAGATISTAMGVFSTGATTGSEVTGVTNDNLVYFPGSEMYCEFTAAFSAPSSSTGAYQRIGIYGGAGPDGFQIGYEKNVFGVAVWKNGSQTFIPQASWNSDQLNGTTGLFTSNGIVQTWVPSNLNLYRIRYLWFGAGPIVFEICSPDGVWITLHNLRQPNTSATPSIYATTLPVTLDIANGAGTANLSISTGCWSAGNTGLQPENTVFTGSLTATSGAGSTVAISMAGQQSCGVTFFGQTSGTNVIIQAQASCDLGTTWATTVFLNLATRVPIFGNVAITGTTPIVYGIVLPPGATHARVVAKTIISGTVNVTLAATAVAQSQALAYTNTNGGVLVSGFAQIAGSDGTDARAVLTDATGQVKVLVEGGTGIPVTEVKLDAAITTPGAAAPANVLQVGGTDGTDIRTVLTDVSGRTVSVLNAARTSIGTASLDSASAVAVVFIPAIPTVFSDITSLVITNDNASTATIVSLSDNGAGGTVYKFALAAAGGIVVNFPTPLPQGTVGVAWDVLNSAAVSLHYTAVFVKNH